MKRTRLNLLIVDGEGRRVVRLHCPRWAVFAAAGTVGLSLLTLVAISGDYLFLRSIHVRLEESAILQRRLVEQQRVIDGFEARIRQVRAEMDGWTDLHARIWQPFGPEMGPASRGTGVGGGTALRHIEVSGAGGSVADELERLVGAVTEAGENLRALERFMGKAARVLAALPFRWPLRGPINSEFGRRLSPWSSGTTEFHSGMDIGARPGTPIIAPAPGTVAFAGRQPEYGLTLIIDHGNDIKTLYGHLADLHVSAEQRVERGQVVALTGNTGRSSGPHLHYEILVKGQPVNPRGYLWE
jgi:murein DD-endopeptidase MepM/ murein hydrolase activator NlpD